MEKLYRIESHHALQLCPNGDAYVRASDKDLALRFLRDLIGKNEEILLAHFTDQPTADGLVYQAALRRSRRGWLGCLGWTCSPGGRSCP